MEINRETVSAWLDTEIEKWKAADGYAAEIHVDAYQIMKRDLLGDEEAAAELMLYDDDLMPFGKHKGVRLNDVPDDYLDWCYKQDWIENQPKLLDYIQRVKDGKSTARPDNPNLVNNVIPPPPPMSQSEHNTSVAERATQLAREKQKEIEEKEVEELEF